MSNDDPNKDRKDYLRQEISETLGHITTSAVRVEEAKAELERDLARFDRLKKELDGIERLERNAIIDEVNDLARAGNVDDAALVAAEYGITDDEMNARA